MGALLWVVTVGGLVVLTTVLRWHVRVLDNFLVCWPWWAVPVSVWILRAECLHPPLSNMGHNLLFSLSFAWGVFVCTSRFNLCCLAPYYVNVTCSYMVHFLWWCSQGPHTRAILTQSVWTSFPNRMSWIFTVSMEVQCVGISQPPWPQNHTIPKKSSSASLTGTCSSNACPQTFHWYFSKT